MTAAWDQFVSSHPNAGVVCKQGRQTLYRLTGVEAPAAAKADGSPLPVVVIRPSVNEGAVASMIDKDRTTRWESGPQSDRVVVELDLGAVRTVSAIELSLGPFVEDFPRGLMIEASEDGTAWNEVWQGGAAGLAFVAAFEAPLDVPMRFRFSPVRARLLRMRLTKNDDTYYWSIAEMKVLGQ